MLDFISTNVFDTFVRKELVNQVDDIENLSMFSKLLDTQLKFDNDYHTELKNYYLSINEATNVKSKFSKVIIKLIEEYIKNLNYEVNKFVNSFRKRINEDKEIFKPYLDKLKKYDSNDSITIEHTRYKYTHIFEDPIPNDKALEEFIDVKMDIDKAVGSDKSMTNNQRLELLKDEYTKLVEYIKSGECYSKARGELLGTKSQVNAENFSEEIFKCFRAGGDVLSDNVTPLEIREAATRFNKYDSIIRDITSEKNSVWKEYKWIINNLNRIDIEYMSNWFGTSKEEFNKFYDLYIKLKTEQLLRLSALHNQVYFAKLDAIIKSYLQDREILMKACGYVQTKEQLIDSNEEIVDEYALYLVEENYIAIESYLAMLEANGEQLALDESTIIPLDEATFDNLKNYLINACQKLSDVMDKFIGRVTELVKADEKFLDNNQAKLLSDQMIKNEATLSNYYPYSDLVSKISSIKFPSAGVAEFENRAEAGQWQTMDDYLAQGGTNGIAGFTYTPNNGTFKEQLENFLRGNSQDISSNNITQQMRANLFGYCKSDFNNLKNIINTNKASLKAFGTAMDTLISTLTNNSNAQTTTTVQQQTVQQVGNQMIQQASFTYEDTMSTYLNEVEIKSDNPNGGIPNNQAAANANMEKQEANEKKEHDRAVANAAKSFIKVNIQKCSACMNIANEAYRQSMKILRWYLKEYNKQNGETQNNNQNNTQQTTTRRTETRTTNQTISGAIG